MCDCMGRTVSGTVGDWSLLSTDTGGVVTAGASVPITGLAIPIVTSVGGIPITCFLLVLHLVPVIGKNTINYTLTFFHL